MHVWLLLREMGLSFLLFKYSSKTNMSAPSEGKRLFLDPHKAMNGHSIRMCQTLVPHFWFVCDLFDNIISEGEYVRECMCVCVYVLLAGLDQKVSLGSDLGMLSPPGFVWVWLWTNCTNLGTERCVCVCVGGWACVELTVCIL